MDYKKKVELLGWHSKYVKLNGTESRLLNYLIFDCDYKTSDISLSYQDMANMIDSSKLGISKAIKKLLDENLIYLIEKGSGLKAANYRISTIDKLNYLYGKEEYNLCIRKWNEAHDNLFYDIHSEEMNLNYEIEECQECKDSDLESKLCINHYQLRKELEENILYRKRKLWLMDNPKPDSHIKTIKGVKEK